MLRVALLVAVTAGVASQYVFNVYDYGAKGDGVTDDTAAVRATLQAAGNVSSACDSVCATVVFPASGRFLTGAFNLSSNLVLSIEGTILGSQDSADYVLIPPLPWYGGGQDAQMSGAPEWQALLHSWFANNIVITGGGVIDGQGTAWWSCRRSASPPCNGYSRPNLMMLVHSTNIQMFNITIQNSPSWTVHFANCTNVHVWNTTVTAPSDSPNTDGFDVDCSSNVLIEESSYTGGESQRPERRATLIATHCATRFAGDDAVAIKSGINWLGRTFGRRSENVTIRNMQVGSSHGLSVGSEMSAGVRNVTFTDISMIGTSAGPHVKSSRGRGGIVEDIYYRNINISMASAGVYVTMNYNKNVAPTNATATPIFRNIFLNNLLVDGALSGWLLDGLNESIITNMSISDVTMTNVALLVAQDDYTAGTCVRTTPSCPPLLPNP